MNRFRILEAKKEEMLDKAKDCFVSAINIYTACQGIDEPQDERWLYQYMLAKIAEKKSQDPPVFLKHYSKASELLNENNAQYPKRINHKNPQNLSIEALEVYYRIHASILKYLDQHEGEPLKKSIATVLENNLQNCMQSSFMKYNSIFKKFSKENNSIRGTKVTIRKELCNIKNNDLSYRSRPTIINTNKSDTRKRSIEDLKILNKVNKINLSSVSHLQLMQDVVALIDDLITKVCHDDSFKQNEKDLIFKSKLNMNMSNPIVIQSNYNSEYQIFMDSSIKQENKFNQGKGTLIIDDVDENKFNRKWFQKEQLQTENERKSEKVDEKKYTKGERTVSRRSSQESTTTQTSTSETNNSTSSSSDDSTTTEDSSDTSTSSESDSDSIESNIDKKKKESLQNYTYLTEADTIKLVEYCLSGLEQCVLTFPEHYKSIYRLAYFFFYNKMFKNIDKCKQLLLTSYKCQFHQNQIIQGLFAERKNTNFFNGIWRIPINEIDRPGSFASHMSRCIVLLMQVLKETGDGRMLIELCIQLRKTPEADKKYLRDSEREQLAGQALTLCLQCFRNKIKIINMYNLSVEQYNNHIEEKAQVLLDIYYVYQSIKNIQEYEILELPKVRKLLEDGYQLYIGNTDTNGNTFELAKEYCRQKIRASKSGPTLVETNINPQPTGEIVISNLCDLSNTFVTNNRKSQKSPSTTGKSRGRPPGIQKCSQVINSNSLIQNEDVSNNSGKSTTYLSNKNCNSTYSINPFMEPNILAAMLGPSFNANIIDSTFNYFNQATAYQNMSHRQNINIISKYNDFNKKKSENLSKFLTGNNVHHIESDFEIDKNKSDVSITPVTDILCQEKPKCLKLTTNISQNENSNTCALFNKSVKTRPSSRISYFKTTQSSQRVTQPLTDYKMSLTTNNTENSINTNCIIIPETNRNTISAIDANFSSPRPGTSLQHKLLSKKYSQHPYQFMEIHKPEQDKPIVTSNETNTDKIISTSHNKVTDSTTTKLTPLYTSKFINLHSVLQKSNTNIDVPVLTKSFQNSQFEHLNTLNTLSTGPHLQQHSSIEIVPQINHVKQNINLLNIPGRSVEAHNLFSNNSISIYELSKYKNKNNYSTPRIEKLNQKDKNNVEIITLDD